MKNLNVILTIVILFSALITFTYSTSCTNNWLSGSCVGDITYTLSNSLTGNVYNSGNIIVNTGVTLAFNGYYTASGGNFINNGIITGGNLSDKTAAASGGNGGVSGNNAINISMSFGGSGGSGGQCGGGSSIITSGYGGNSLVVGGAGITNSCTGGNGNTGGTPSAPPVLDNTNVITWTDNVVNFFSGIPGGSGSKNGAETSGFGANGIFGGFVEANSFINNNEIFCPGNNGGASLGASYSAGGGGSGGCWWLIDYSNGGSYTAGTSNVLGGIGGAGSSTGGSGGNGGNGRISVTTWTSMPITVPTTSSTTSTTTIPTTTSSTTTIPTTSTSTSIPTTSTSTSTSTTTSTTFYTTYSTTIIPGLNGTYYSVYLSGFNYVDGFVYILMLLGFGIGYIRSSKLSNGFLGAAVVSYIALGIYIAAKADISWIVTASAATTILFVFITWLELNIKSK